MQLGSSLRSREGCEALSKGRHHEKINIIESSAVDSICIKIDTELNETTPVMSFKRFQIDFYIINKILQKYMSNGPQK